MAEDINSNEVLIDCYDKSIYPENTKELRSVQNYKELNDLYKNKIIGGKKREQKDDLEIYYVYAILISFFPIVTLINTLVRNPEKKINYITQNIYLCWVIIFSLMFNSKIFVILFYVFFNFSHKDLPNIYILLVLAYTNL